MRKDCVRRGRPKSPAIIQRNEGICAAYLAGENSAQIAARIGVSQQCITKILRDSGVDAWAAMMARRATASATTSTLRAAAREARKAKIAASYGMSVEEFSSIKEIAQGMLAEGRSQHATPLNAFSHQRAGAKERGIEWDMTFAEWWGVWLASGKFDQRGRGARRYVMSRRGDVGAYAVGNVFIQLGILNNSDRPQKANGLPVGVVRLRGCITRPFGAHCKRDGVERWLGTFASVEDAVAAYEAA